MSNQTAALVESIILRDAQPQDDSFLRQVYAGTRQELALLDWPAAFKEGFLSMQYEAQQCHYRSAYPLANWWIVQQQEVPIGRLIVSEGPSQLLLVDISLLPEFRRRGIGTHLLCRLQQHAAQSAKTILLHVEQSNPAFHLYRRLGFSVTTDHGMYFEMLWKGAHH